MVDFPVTEFETRMALIQTAMAQAGLDAILLCTEAELRYFSGFRTQFWQSPTRPWFLVLPLNGAPIAVIPEIGASLMACTWVNDIRTWASPDPVDDGVSLLADVLSAYSKVGLPMGPEASLRMPLGDFTRVQEKSNVEFIDCSGLIKAIRIVKSDAEIAILRKICRIGSAAFDKAGNLFHAGLPLNEAFRAFKIALLQEGAEDVPYLVGAAGQGGYGDVISPPGDAPLRNGDILMLDTGASLQGYFCDFDRNFATGHADDAAKQAYETLWQATQTGLQAARAGATCADLFHAMHKTLGGGRSNVGRYGHGLGIQLTEHPSIASFDHTVLQPGMVMTLEPSLTISKGKMMVHEENILITDGAPVLLTKRAPAELPVII
ncbi:MAG: aminopeptidase P family protein [Proteobacteria bacterium]|nr:aminopeptidase P family protein [Pseudomonadota bacterium]